MSLSNEERLNLKKMMSEMDYQDNTSTIRRLKHSTKIRDDIRKIENLKREYSVMRVDLPEQFFNIAYTECRFLYDNYIDIFTRIMKNEIDMVIMTKLLIVLKLIEDGQMDQEDGSVRIGRLLKELYLDSAVKRADNLDSEHAGETVEPNVGKTVSWNTYKKVNLP